MHWEHESNTSLHEIQFWDPKEVMINSAQWNQGRCWDGTGVVYLVLKRKRGGKGGKGTPPARKACANILKQEVCGLTGRGEEISEAKK